MLMILNKNAVLKIIKEAQQQHGLRHGDYQRYRGYCSRRLRRLRKVLKVPQGDRRHFKRKDITPVMVSEDKFLQVPLIMAERAWSYAMQLRQESNTEPRKKFHLISRLKKAASYSLQLQDLIEVYVLALVFDRMGRQNNLIFNGYPAEGNFCVKYIKC